jgi:hypothetical protein
VYDKLGVADRLELALYCLSHHVVDGVKPPPMPEGASPAVSASSPVPTNGAAAASASAGSATSSTASAVSSSVRPSPAGPDKLP